MLLFLDIFLTCCAISMAITYLYFIQIIRTRSDCQQITTNNFFILNPIRVYFEYIKCRKKSDVGNGIAFYLHFVFIFITLILGYFLDGYKP